MRNFSKSFPAGNHPKKLAPHNRQTSPLGDNRYSELMQKASAFFAASERDVDAERAQAIAEICNLMAQYGISAEDLR